MKRLYLLVALVVLPLAAAGGCSSGDGGQPAVDDPAVRESPAPANGQPTEEPTTAMLQDVSATAPPDDARDIDEELLRLTVTPDPTALAATPAEFAEMIARSMPASGGATALEYEVLGVAEVQPDDGPSLGVPAEAVARDHVPDIAVVFAARADGEEAGYMLLVADRITGGYELKQHEDPQVLLDMLP